MVQLDGSIIFRQPVTARDYTDEDVLHDTASLGKFLGFSGTFVALRRYAEKYRLPIVIVWRNNNGLDDDMMSWETQGFNYWVRRLLQH